MERAVEKVMAERIIEIDEDGNVSIPLDPEDEITQLKADLAQLEQDGKRLDWLEKNWPSLHWHGHPERVDNTLREGIDHWMKAKAKEGG